MLLRTPDIGGSSLEMNLYIAAFVFSLHKAHPEKITPEVVDEMVTAVFESPFMIKAHKNKKCTLKGHDPFRVHIFYAKVLSVTTSPLVITVHLPSTYALTT